MNSVEKMREKFLFESCNIRAFICIQYAKEVMGLQSFDEMFSQYFGRVYRFALRLTRSTDQAEDITDRFEDGVCRLTLTHGDETMYFTVMDAGDGAYSVSAASDGYVD